MRRKEISLRSPPTHNVTRATKDFGQTADYNICKRQNIDIDEIPDCFVYDEQEIVLIRQRTESRKISRTKEWVGWEFGKKGENGRRGGI